MLHIVGCGKTAADRENGLKIKINDTVRWSFQSYREDGDARDAVYIYI